MADPAVAGEDDHPLRWLNHKWLGGACLVAERRRRYRPPGGAAPRQVLTPGEQNQSGPHITPGLSDNVEPS